MILKRYLKLLPILLLFSVCQNWAAINFGERHSAIRVSDGAKLNFQGDITLEKGSLIRETTGGAQITGDAVNFSQSILQSGASESLITAEYDPTGAYDIINLGGSHSVRAEPGQIWQAVNVSGNNNSIEGQPTFLQNITLADANTTLTFGLQNKLNKNVVMNDGRLFLVDDLRLCDDVQLTGQGRVILNDRQFQFGGKDLDWAGRIYWDHATDLVMNSKISLSTTWSFGGTSYLNGNGNILDLSQGGTLWVRSGATLNLTDVKIKGLGSGWFVFEDQTSQIRLSNVDIEMDRTYSVTNGGIYVEGPTTIVTKDKLLIFDLLGSMTVDGETLWYDTLSYNDSENIRPEVPFDTDDVATGGESSHITLQNGGIIRLAAGEGAGEEIGDLYYNDDGTIVFTNNMFLSLDRRMYVNADITIDGNDHYIQFARRPLDSTPQIIIAEGKNVKFTNTVLKDFDEECIGGDGKNNVLFGDHTSIEMTWKEFLSRKWTFSGTCELMGKGNALDLGDGGGQLVAGIRDTNIYLYNLHLTGVHGNNLRCDHNNSRMYLYDCNIDIDRNFTWSLGRIDSYGGELKISGTSDFIYESDVQSWIWPYSTLFLDKNLTFSYAPYSENKTLIGMVDQSSRLFLNGATLKTTLTGMQLTKGTLTIDHKNLFYNQDGDGVGAASVSQAITFGDGTAANDLHIEIMPGGNFEVMNGILDYQNAS